MNKLDDVTMRSGKHFPNGFRSWLETFYEITTNISTLLGNDDFEHMKSATIDLYRKEGSAAMYDRAIALTDEFEKGTEGKVWGVDTETDFIDAVDLFFIAKELE